jgi:hypothetical protein
MKSMLSGMMVADIAWENERNENCRQERRDRERRRAASFQATQQATLAKQLAEEQVRLAL